eukprot:TRINITY_DN3565_c1_g1_i1.p1 TRINITY_DN3565_c1_g1~~TRINITY_DN3565_c1_g1_i1.p1  ORF type:complete len:354 (-),score=35.77 TRINITY_DN3565_c1_g1_i1:360-1364(-)
MQLYPNLPRSLPLRQSSCTNRQLFPRCGTNGNTDGLNKENLLEQILQGVAKGEIDPQQASFLINQEQMSNSQAGFLELGGYAKLDHQRADRTGENEVVWGPGKTPQQIANIMTNLSLTQKYVIATRIEPQVYAEVRVLLPGVEYNALAKILKYENPNSPNAVKAKRLPGIVCIATAGTADQAVAEECRLVCETLGVYAFRIADVGVAGIHRLFGSLDSIRSADVVICVAGMDAALPSVLAGLVKSPVIAVPTSVGYGVAFSGVAPLLSSLNACAPGVTVVNIDNGFGAAVAAARILRSVENINYTREKQRLQQENIYNLQLKQQLSDVDQDGFI